jgi:hypothetical protein
MAAGRIGMDILRKLKPREILEEFLEGRPYRREYLIAHNGRLAGAGAYAYVTRQ